MTWPVPPHAKRKLDSLLDDAAAAILLEQPAAKHARTEDGGEEEGAGVEEAAAASSSSAAAAAQAPGGPVTAAAAGVKAMTVVPLDQEEAGGGAAAAAADGWTRMHFAPRQICDVTIRYTNLRLAVHAHRYVLMRHSTVFQAVIDALLVEKTDTVDIEVAPFTSASDAEAFFRVLYAKYPDREIARIAHGGLAYRPHHPPSPAVDPLHMAHLLDHMGCVAMFRQLASAWEVQVGDGCCFLLDLPIAERVRVARRYHWVWLLDATVARITKEEAELMQTQPVVAAALASRMAAAIYNGNQATARFRELARQIGQTVSDVRDSLAYPKHKCVDRLFCADDHAHEIDWATVEQGDFRVDLWEPLRAIDTLATDTARQFDLAALRISEDAADATAAAAAAAAAAIP